MPLYRLTPLAVEDLQGIWRFGAERWGLAKTELYGEKILDAFEFIAENPHAGYSVGHIREGYQRLVVGSHLIFYRVVADGVEIVRILHQRMDVDQQLQS